MNTTGKYITNQGDLILEQIGEKVKGKYSKAGHLEGSISGNVITGIWKNLEKEGLFEFVFSDDLSFKGKYKIGTEQGSMRSKWDGQITILNNNVGSSVKNSEVINDVNTNSEKKNGTAKWKDEEGNVFDGTWENDRLIKGIITYHDGGVEEGEFNTEGLNGYGKWINGSPKNVLDDQNLDEESLVVIGESIKKMGMSTVFDLFRSTYTHYKIGGILYDLSKSEIINLLELYLKSCIAEYNRFEYLNPESILSKKLSDILPKKITSKFENGDFYEGEFKDGKFHGTGTLKFKNGDYYEGEFKDGKRHGTGIFYDKKNDTVREGKWFLDKVVLSESEKKQEEKKRNEAIKAHQLWLKQIEKEEEKEREKEEKEREKNKKRRFKISYTYVKDGSSIKWDEYIYIYHVGQSISESQARTYVKSKDYYISEGKGKLIGIKSIEVG